MPLFVASHAQLVAAAFLLTLAAASFPSPIELLPAAASDSAECARPAGIDDIRDELEAGGYTVRGERGGNGGDGTARKGRAQQLTYDVDCYDGRGVSTAAAVFADNILSLSACVKWDDHTPRQKILVTHAWNTLHRTSVAVMNRDGDYCLEWSMLVLDEDSASTVRRHVAWGTREFDRQWCSFRVELPGFEVENEDEEAVEGYMVSGAGMADANGLYLPDGYSDGVRMFRRAGADEGALFRWRGPGMRAMWYVSVKPSGDSANDWYHAAGTGASPPREGWITIAKGPGAYPAPRVEALPSRSAQSLATEELDALDDALMRTRAPAPSSLDGGVPVAALASPQVMDAASADAAAPRDDQHATRGSGTAGSPKADPWDDAGGGGVLGHGPEAARKRIERVLESRKARIAARRAARKAEATKTPAEATSRARDSVGIDAADSESAEDHHVWRAMPRRHPDQAPGRHTVEHRDIKLATPDTSSGKLLESKPRPVAGARAAGSELPRDKPTSQGVADDKARDSPTAGGRTGDRPTRGA